MTMSMIRGAVALALAAGLAAASGCAETADGGASGFGGAGGSTTSNAETSGTSAAGGGAIAPCDPATDHSSDPLNCGSCEHDCLGGACSAGTCQPLALWTGRGAAPLFVDDDWVYWAKPLHLPVEEGCAQYGLVRAPKLTGPISDASDIVARAPGITTDVSIKNGFVYFGADGCEHSYQSAHRFPIDASSPTVEKVASFHPEGGGIAPGATALYALVATAIAVPVPYDVVSLPLGGGPMTTLASNQVGAELLVTDDINIYWTLNDDILSMPVTGGAPATLVSGDSLQANLSSSFTADGALYYTAFGSPTMSVWRLSVGDTAPGQMIWQSEVGQLGDLVESGNDVCFVYDFTPPKAQDSIVCAAKDGSEVDAGRVVFPSSLGITITALTADDHAVYWIQNDAYVSGNAGWTLQRLVK